MTDLSWQKHFPEASERIQSWYSEAQPRESLLYWCIRRGDILQDDYFAWAQNHYELPILENRFFNSNPDLEFLIQCRHKYAWNIECVPVAEWNGMVFVACLTPPEDLRNAPPGQWCFLLASQEQLDKWWQQIKPYLYPNADVSDLDVKIGGPGSENTAKDPTELFGNIDSKPVSPLDPSSFTRGRSTQTNFTKEVTTGLHEAKAKSTGEEERQSLSEKSSTHTLHPIDFEQKSHLKTANTKAQAHMVHLYNQCYGRLKKFYQKTMIWIIEGDEAKAIHWESSFTPNPDTIKKPISLQNPSVFRIVFRSHKPYHGHMVVNQVNSLFVSQWNDNLVPETITLAPILVSGHLSGFILSVADQDVSGKQSLHAAESSAKQLATEVSSVLGLKKKAASA